MTEGPRGTAEKHYSDIVISVARVVQLAAGLDEKGAFRLTLSDCCEKWAGPIIGVVHDCLERQVRPTSTGIGQWSQDYVRGKNEQRERLLDLLTVE